MGRREQLRQRISAFKKRFLLNVRKTHPKVAFKIFGAIIIFFPWMFSSLVSSMRKLGRWRKIETCQALMRRNTLAFDGVDINTLRVESVSGGISNSNEIWHCKKFTGEDIRYFVKIFVPAGSFCSFWNISWKLP